MTSRLLFPTRLFERRISDSGILDELEESCWMVEDGDSAGHAWCEEKGYPGYTSYASLDDLPSRAPAFADLETHLLDLARQAASELGWDLEDRKIALDAIWINILGEGGHHSGHIHPGSILSGTLYVAVPEGAGDIRFEDPRLARMMAAPPLLDDVAENQRRFVYVTPKPGDILIWESWLRHEVMPGKSDEPRISISFNFACSR
ncbi:TIGR02466 family protein [Henriciella marina]|uniref:TIGR02466 family protein n=1 Tax=Henriciella marina TaxID=453851 RepID=UPI00037D4D39|nr:TIGR02466 family protein [Henriciella marina]